MLGASLCNAGISFTDFTLVNFVAMKAKKWYTNHGKRRVRPKLNPILAAEPVLGGLLRPLNFRMVTGL